MKNRVLSLVLAVLMVFSMSVVLSVSSFAEGESVTIKLGNANAQAGKLAYVDIYVEAAGIDEKYVLREVEFTVETDLAFADTKECGFFVEEGVSYGTTNTTQKKYAATVKDGYLASPASYGAKGGVKIGTLALLVPENAEASYTVTVNDIAVVGFNAKTNVEDKISLVDATTATVATVNVFAKEDGYTVANEGNGGVYTVPTVNAAGELVKSLYADEDDTPALSGSYGTLIIPAAVCDADAIADVVGEATVTNLVLKDADMDVGKTTLRSIGGSVDTIYYVKNVLDDEAPIVTTYKSLTAAQQKAFAVKNVIAVNSDAVVDGNNVSVVFGLAAEDLGYEKLTVVASFVGAESKTFEADLTSLYKTVTGVATTNATTAETQSVAAVEDFAYISALTVKDVPAGSYEVEVTLYAEVENANGAIITVVSDVQTINVTVA